MNFIHIHSFNQALKLMILAFLISFFSISCGPSDHALKIADMTGDPVNGKVVYESKTSPSCASCHGATARGGSGPNIKSEVSDEGEFIDFVLEGEGSMPAYDSQLTDQEIADLVAYVKSL